MYDLSKWNPEVGNLTLKVQHVTAGPKGTCLEVEATAHLKPEAANPQHSVSGVTLDIRFVSAASLPEFAEELARILERTAAGLRQGAGGGLGTMFPAAKKEGR